MNGATKVFLVMAVISIVVGLLTCKCVIKIKDRKTGEVFPKNYHKIIGIAYMCISPFCIGSSIASYYMLYTYPIVPIIIFTFGCAVFTLLMLIAKKKNNINMF